MKRLLIIVLLLTNVSIAATTGQITLTGVVPSLLSVTVNQQAIATNLDLSLSQTDTLVGSVTEESNSNTGYKIKMSSLNSGKLLRNSGTETFNYSLKYDGQLVNFNNLPNPVQVKSITSSGVYNNSSDVTITYTGIANSSMVAGTYQDTVTFTIEAN